VCEQIACVADDNISYSLLDDARWLAPFGSVLHSTLACLHETSLSTLTQRMTRLPQRIGLML